MSHRGKYSKVKPSSHSSTEVTTDADSDVNTDIDDHQQTNTNKDDNKTNRLHEIKSSGNCFKWMMKNPLSKLPFFYFFLSILIPFALGIYYFMDNDTAFIIAGISGLIINVYGFNHFRNLLYLKQEIDNFHKLNKQFSKENKILNIEVDKLLAANDNLKDMHTKLLNINIKTKENLQQFRNIEDNLKLANLDSIAGIENVRDKANKIQTDWKQQLLRKERDVLYRVFDRFEQKDKSDGMTKDEFEDFSKNVPEAYKERFDRLGTFKKLAGRKSYIDYKDFQSCLDLFAQMNVEDVDMDFKIERKEEHHQQQQQLLSVPSEEMMPVLGRQVSITKRSKPGVKFTADDIEYDDDEYRTDDDFNSDND